MSINNCIISDKNKIVLKILAKFHVHNPTKKAKFLQILSPQTYVLFFLWLILFYNKQAQATENEKKSKWRRIFFVFFDGPQKKTSRMNSNWIDHIMDKEKEEEGVCCILCVIFTLVACEIYGNLLNVIYLFFCACCFRKNVWLNE